jgi:hypothetical protein
VAVCIGNWNAANVVLGIAVMKVSIEAYDYGKQDGMDEELQIVLDTLKKLKDQYYEAKPTAEIALHPFEVAIREVEKLLNTKETNESN